MNDTHITVDVNENLAFEVSQQKSTIYHSIKGMRGNAAGVYLSVIDKNPYRHGYAIQYPSQKAIIEKMENMINEQ